MELIWTWSAGCYKMAAGWTLKMKPQVREWCACKDNVHQCRPCSVYQCSNMAGGFQDKIATFFKFLFPLSYQKDTKETPPNEEVCHESPRAMLKYWPICPVYIVTNPTISNMTGSNTNLYNETRRNSLWNWFCKFLEKDKRSRSKHWIVWLNHHLFWFDVCNKFKRWKYIFPVTSQSIKKKIKSSRRPSHIRFATICFISQCKHPFRFYAMLNIC